MRSDGLESELSASTNLELRSRVSSNGEVRVWLEDGPVPAPGADEVLIAMEAVPINPSDVSAMFGPAEVGDLVADGTVTHPALSAIGDRGRLRPMRGRLDEPITVGLEGAGRVLAAGRGGEHLLGRLVAAQTPGTFARYRVARIGDCLPVPDGTAARTAAAAYINPLTVLCMLETLRGRDHHALVHTAAASNLGQMLQHACRADGIALVNVVRSARQEQTLRSLGAEHVVNTEDPDFADELDDVVATTGATIAFDAVGGGELANAILSSMERAAPPPEPGYSRYGSEVMKELYLYGGLDPLATVLRRDYGMAWSVGGWLVFRVLKSLPETVVRRMRRRVAAELTTTFASHFDEEISLTQALDPDVVLGYAARATGRKYLLNPTLDVDR